MGWAGPAQPTGLDSAQKCWPDFGPKIDWADLGPRKLISPSGPGPAQKARLGFQPKTTVNGVTVHRGTVHA